MHRPSPTNERNGGNTMFDPKSDYALNKMDPTAIVYIDSSLPPRCSWQHSENWHFRSAKSVAQSYRRRRTATDGGVVYKMDPTAIVYIDSTGTLVRLTLEDFSSVKEFQYSVCEICRTVIPQTQDSHRRRRCIGVRQLSSPSMSRRANLKKTAALRNAFHAQKS